MKKQTTSTFENPPEGLFERAVQLAKDLRMVWVGHDGGVMLVEGEDGKRIWRAHSDWAGTGSHIDFDAGTGDVLLVAEAWFESVGKRQEMLPKFRPTEAEALTFLTDRCRLLGWESPGHVTSNWDSRDSSWSFKAGDSTSHSCLEGVVRGKTGHLYLARLSRR